MANSGKRGISTSRKLNGGKSHHVLVNVINRSRKATITQRENEHLKLKLL